MYGILLGYLIDNFRCGHCVSVRFTEYSGVLMWNDITNPVMSGCDNF